MKANDFAHEDEMPEPVPVEEHPFMAEGGSGEESEKNFEEGICGQIKGEEGMAKGTADGGEGSEQGIQGGGQVISNCHDIAYG